jgi:bifunctional ADP-heptose synthase (sugar kinase/adenylyltransferase)
MKKVAFLKGRFDPICTKHLELFKEIKEYMDCLVVLVEYDDSPPILNLTGRLKILNSLDSVDEVSVFSDDNMSSLMEKYRKHFKDYTLLSDGEIYMEQPANVEFTYMNE